MFDLNNILRNNIKNLVAYSSARDEYQGKAGIFLDANENAYGSPVMMEVEDEELTLNRYPDPLQLELKAKIRGIKGLPVENIFLGNGSDEAIDILFRAFCNPGKDNVITCPPTYGMYEVSANINDVAIKTVPLIADTFQLDTDAIIDAIDASTKLIFICSPNNPTGTAVNVADMKRIADNFKGLIVVDEAYINFATYRSFIPELLNHPNLVILQTFSKAWGMAGLRLGMAFASEAIIAVFNKVKPPYNINVVSQKMAIGAMDNMAQVNEWTKTVVRERSRLSQDLLKFTFVSKVYPSDANFLLLKTDDAKGIYDYLIEHKIIIRDRSKVTLCEGCLRITIGTPEENELVLNALNAFGK